MSSHTTIDAAPRQRSPVFSLKLKVILAVSAMALAVGSALSWWFLTQSEKILREELQKRASSFSQHLARSSKYGLLTEDREILADLIDGVFEEEGVLFVRIRTAQGKTLIERTRPGAERFSPAAHEASASELSSTKPTMHYHLVDGIGVYHTVTPVISIPNRSDQDKKLSTALMIFGEERSAADGAAPQVVRHGQVEMLFSSQKVLTQIHRTFVSGTLVTLLTIAAAILVALPFINYVVGPLRAMAGAAMKISSGDLSPRVEVRSRDEIGVLASTFNQMSESLEKMTSAQEQRLAELSAVHEIGLAISSTWRIDEVIAITLNAVVQRLGYDKALFFRFDRETNALVEGRVEGVPTSIRDKIKEMRIPLSQDAGLCSRVAMRGEPIIVTDPPDIGSVVMPPLDEAFSSNGSLIAVPVKFEDKIFGVLAAQNLAGDREVCTGDLPLLTTLSNQLAISMANASSYMEIERLNTDLERKVEERTAELQVQQDRLERVNAELREATRHKSEFLAKMSHELRTPLNAIIGYSEMLVEEAEDAGDMQRADDLGKIRSAGRHLLSLINDVLDLAKIEAGKVDLYLEDIAVREIVTDVVSTVRPLIDQNRNRLDLECPQDAGSMRVDVTKLRQMLFNLLSNASKFTEDGWVRLTIARRLIEGEAWLRFEIADSGIGMSPEQLSNLFQEFSQADASTTRKYGGTGLGLAISKRFCDMMGGRIDVSSAPEHGSVFTIWLPARVQEPRKVEDAAKRLPVADHAPGASTTDRCRVLVVDDDAAVRNLMSRFLNREGFEVVCAADGRQGLRLAREMHPDAITLDVLMPDMDGWSVLTTIKSEPELSEIPVIMVTMLDEKDLGYSLGAADYVSKPIGRQRLAQIIRRHCLPDESSKILVVEDDRNSRDMMLRLIEHEGWPAAGVENGRDALQWLRDHVPSLILLDLIMPVMDGLEFLEEFRSSPEWRSIPVVVLTCKDLSTDDRARLQGQVQRVLEKGRLSRRDLLNEIRVLMASHLDSGTVSGVDSGESRPN